MRKFIKTDFTKTIATFFLCWCFFVDTAISDPRTECEGTEFKGAWFTAIIPSGMKLDASRVEHGGGGALSAWLRSHDGSTEFYLFSPQWGGIPYEIFKGVKSKRQITKIETQSLQSFQLELIYQDSIGRYSTTKSVDPVSHLTVGYRTQTGMLTEAHFRKYDCFLNSINQYSD